MVRIESNKITLKGSAGARIFRRGQPPVEMSPVSELAEVLYTPAGVA
jgi:hypothetical protein